MRQDGALINALTGLGTTKSKIETTRIGYTQLVSQTELETLYSYGLVRRIVDAIANEMHTRVNDHQVGSGAGRR